MKDLSFFKAADGVPLAEIAARADAQLPKGADPSSAFEAAVALTHARPRQVAAFLDDHTLEDLTATSAGACLVTKEHAPAVPAGTVALVTPDPDGAFQRVALALHPGSSNRGLRPTGAMDGVHVEARLEAGAIIDPGVVVGAGAEIGSRTFVGAFTVIGPGVRIGRDCVIDPHVTITNALVGDRVVVQSGARIGNAELSSAGHSVARASIGRVIIQNDVEIGVNAVMQRGEVEDTVVGEHSVIESSVFVSGGTIIDRCSHLRRPFP